MKVLSTILLVLAMIVSGNTDAQTTDPATISYVTNVSLPADDVWKQIRKMDNIDKISSFVGSLSWSGPKGVNGVRTCVTPDGQGKFVEKIVAFDDEARSYSWEVIEGVPASPIRNSFRVVPTGKNSSVVVWTSHYTFLENPQMTEDAFKQFMNTAIAEMVDNLVELAK